MPNPKRRHSQQRSAKRRTHYKLAAPTMVKCPSCGEYKLPHHVCEACGQYESK